MNKELELVKFNLTKEMSLELIKFNKLKKKLYELKKLYNLDKNVELLLQINKIERDLIKTRNKFIKEFRVNNQEEIIRYLELKDQKWSFFSWKKGFLNFL